MAETGQLAPGCGMLKWCESTMHDLVDLNGGNNLENLRRANQTRKVRLIEEEFQRLMFDVENV